MEQEAPSGHARGKAVAGPWPRRSARPAPALLAMPFLLLLLILYLPKVMAAMKVLWPAALLVYMVTVSAHWVHEKTKSAGAARLRRSLAVGALPLLLLLPTYLAISSLLRLSIEQVQILFATGLSVTYFNLGAVIFSGGRPLDGGRKMPDGGRLLGAGKTVRGTVGGLILATAVGWATVNGPLTGLVVGSLTMLGDLTASLLKRRLGYNRGHPVIILDQLDSIFFILILEGSFHFLGLEPKSLLTLALATFLVQVCGNYILFLLGKKDVPW